MPYYSKCRAMEIQKAGMNIPEKYIIDNGEDCDVVMARMEVGAGRVQIQKRYFFFQKIFEKNYDEYSASMRF